MLHATCYMLRDFMNIIILGPQGSGKGTQAEKLAREFSLEHVDMGKFLREAASLDSDLGREINEIINVRKELVSDEILKKVLHIKLADIARGKGIVFDGVPRRKDQLKYFENAILEFGRKIDRVVVINISGNESVKRISKRMVCENCKKGYVKDTINENKQCENCGGKIVQRIDDTPEGVIKRLNIFQEETMPVIECFREKGLVLEIDGEKSPEEVFQDILTALKEN